MRTNHPAILALSLLTLSSATAQTVYRSVDAEGRVSYSSTPPPGGAKESVEQVRLAPGPTVEQQREAEERAKALEAASTRSDKQRQQEAEKSSSASGAAEKELNRSRMELEEAKIQGDDDWQTLVTGGRVLKQSYLDRVKRAEEQVRKAEEATRNAGRSRR